MTQSETRSGSSARAAIEDVTALVAVGYVGQVVTFIMSVALRRILGPGEVGWVAVLGLAAAYAPYLGLGTLQAAERLIALEIGRADHDAAADVEAAAALIIAVLSAVVVAGSIFIVATTDLGPDAVRAVGAVAATVVVQQFAVLAIVRLRTRLRFRTVAVTALATSALTSCGGVLGGAVGHLLGALIGTVLGYTVGAAISVRASGIQLRRATVHALRRVIFGAPAFLALGAATILLYTIDQVIAGALLGATAFGLYTTAYLGNAFLVRIPANVSSALYPRLQISFGRGRSPGVLANHAWRATVLSAAVAGLFVGSAIVVLPLAVRLVLPGYAGAVPAMRLVLLAVMGLILAGPASQFLVSLGKQWIVVAATFLAALAILAGSAVAATVQVVNIETIAAIDCASYLTYGIAVYVSIGALVPSDWRRTLQVTLIAYGPPAIALAGASVLDGVAGSDALGLLSAALASTTVLLAVWAGSLAAVRRWDPALRTDLRTTMEVALRVAQPIIRGIRRDR